jgi:hypothetical protein
VVVVATRMRIQEQIDVTLFTWIARERGSAWSNVFPIADSPRDSFEPNMIVVIYRGGERHQWRGRP